MTQVTAETVSKIKELIDDNFEAFELEETRTKRVNVYETRIPNLYVIVVDPAKITKKNAHHVSISFGSTFEDRPDDVFRLVDMESCPKAEALRLKVGLDGITTVCVNNLHTGDIETFVRHVMTFA